jgi:hypothetical protein
VGRFIDILRADGIVVRPGATGAADIVIPERDTAASVERGARGDSKTAKG